MTREQVEQILGRAIPDWQWQVMESILAGNSLNFETRRFSGKRTAMKTWVEVHRALGYRVKKFKYGWKVYER